MPLAVVVATFLSEKEQTWTRIFPGLLEGASLWNSEGIVTEVLAATLAATGTTYGDIWRVTSSA